MSAVGTETQVDPFDWWRRALAGEQGLAIRDGHPECGYYRMKVRHGRGDGSVQRYVPVAYWRDQDGNLLCRVGDRMMEETRALEIWPWVQAEPISYELYVSVIDGGDWPDIDKAVAEQIAPMARGSEIGGNDPPDEAVLLKEQIESAKASVSNYAQIADDETLNKAQSLRSRLLELARDADKRRETEKRPHLEQCKAIDRKWQEMIKDAQAAANALRASMSAWETEKLRRQREAERKAEAERAAQAAAALAEKGVRAHEFAPPPPPVAEVRAPAPIRGGYGRAASSKAVKVITAVSDWPALLAYFQDNEEVRALVRKLAQRAVDAGHAVPGVTVEEQAKVS